MRFSPKVPEHSTLMTLKFEELAKTDLQGLFRNNLELRLKNLCSNQKRLIDASRKQKYYITSTAWSVYKVSMDVYLRIFLRKLMGIRSVLPTFSSTNEKGEFSYLHIHPMIKKINIFLVFLVVIFREAALNTEKYWVGMILIKDI